LVNFQVDVEGPRPDSRLAPGEGVGPAFLKLLDDGYETFLVLGLGFYIRQLMRA
jgi:hypothetical protein